MSIMVIFGIIKSATNLIGIVHIELQRADEKFYHIKMSLI